MNVLIWSPNYAPEQTGIPPLVTDAAEWLARAGHGVEVVTTMPHYPSRRIFPAYRGRIWATEYRQAVTVRRSWLRVRPEESVVDKALYELTSASLAVPTIMRRLRWADVMVCVVPTVTSAYYASLLARRIPLVLWVQDLVPLAAAALTPTVTTRGVLALAAGLERHATLRADTIVVCSPGFADYFESRGVPASRMELIYNWADLDRITPQPPPATAPIRLLYAGNIGYTQGFETLIEAAKLLGSEAHFDIVGDGNAVSHVRRLARDLSNVSVTDSVPAQDFPGLLASHDVHLVLQRRVSAGANLPSKIATYLASGRPVLASIESTTPAGRLLARSGAAIITPPESPTELASAILQLAQSERLRKRLGACGREFAERTLAKHVALGRLEEVIVKTQERRLRPSRGVACSPPNHDS